MNIKDKIRKLLNLANDNGATFGEKQAAYKRAQALMLQYNVDEKDTVTVEFVERTVNYYGQCGGKVWQKNLLNAMAEINGVFMFTKTGSKFMHLYGRNDDIEALLALYEYVAVCIQVETKTQKFPTLHSRTHMMKSFAWGAVTGYVQKIKELHSHEGYGIVLSRYKAVKADYMNGKSFRTQRGKNQVNPEAFKNGVAYGKSINDKPLSARLDRNLLG